ncbi:Hypothetical protein SRAE_2000420800 [Strongyloides ratti]|uniref:Uncharacterized protein n=1 Tax=Strongyloides ratti TaxID=34506 RepID=A0A090LPT6_STRRB|nr:Hypothetical protein SRAE_2000420800 [Strongyloides ratti]CEF69560.2 Hypothetical protein SRAE_2000420800 [Strongyloides ratti]
MKHLNIITIILCIVLILDFCHGMGIKCSFKNRKKDVRYCLLSMCVKESIFHTFVNFQKTAVKNLLYGTYYGRWPLVMKILKMNVIARKYIDQTIIHKFIFKNCKEIDYKDPTYVVFTLR